MLFANEQIGPTSINLHLGTEFMVVDRASNTHYDPLWSRTESGDYATTVHRIKKISPLECFVVHPKQFVLATTLEYVALPRDISGELDGRSVWARQGLQVHSTAPKVHPGARSIITFELQNLEDIPIKLYPGMPVGQLSFYELRFPPCEAYDQKEGRAKYLHSTDAQKGLYCEDIELNILRKQQRKRVQGKDMGDVVQENF
jgi:dCTP deaminase